MGYTKSFYGIKEYLDKHEIYKGDVGMHEIIINSFYNQRGGDNDDSWNKKTEYAQRYFGLFAQYANTWKQKNSI